MCIALFAAIKIYTIMEQTKQKEISTLQLIILAFAAGVCVANIYYSQPIIITLAKYFNVDEAVAGQMPIYSQAGYGFGLLFLAPLGDKVARKKLISACEETFK